MRAFVEPGVVIRIAVRGLAVAAALLLLPSAASAQVRVARLSDDTCLVNAFSSFDDVVMTAVATHDSGSGDLYQAICDDEDCWGFSINRGAQVNVMTTGLTPAEYDWFVCAWNGSVKKVVANLTGGAALFTRQREDGQEVVTIGLDDPRVPDSLRRYAARLERSTPRTP